MADIFISYSREDREKARRLAEILARRGWGVWWDIRLRAGDVWDRVIQDELAAARCVIVLWSKSSIEKDWVREEAKWGKDRKILFPARIDPVDIPIGFGLIQTEDMAGWGGEASHLGLLRLMENISERLRLPHLADSGEGLLNIPIRSASPTSALSQQAVGLHEAVDRIVEIIEDLKSDRNIDLANQHLLDWKAETSRTIEQLYNSGNILSKLDLYAIYPDDGQTTVFNKFINEARKCQKAVKILLGDVDATRRR